MEAWEGRLLIELRIQRPEARNELAQGGKPWEYDRTKSPSPSGAAHFSSMPRDAKFDPTGKPRWRVLPCGSKRNPNSPGVAPPGFRPWAITHSAPLGLEPGRYHQTRGHNGESCSCA